MGTPARPGFCSPAGAPAVLDRLRRELCAAEAATGLTPDGGAALGLGISAIDGVLGGGLSCGALHEIAAAHETETAAATGFALALAARQGSPVLRKCGPHWRERGFDPHPGKIPALDRRGLFARREWRALWAWSRRRRHRPRAADHGHRRARSRCAVGDGGGVALPRRRRGDRRDALTRHRSGDDAAARARGCRRRHPRSASAHYAAR